MYEGLDPDDGFIDDDQFEQFDATVPSGELPISYNGLDFALTPNNTKIRLFGEGALQYNRAMVDVGDGEWVDAKLDDSLLTHLSESGFPTDRPTRPDDADIAFLEKYVTSQTADLAALPETPTF